MILVSLGGQDFCDSLETSTPHERIIVLRDDRSSRVLSHLNVLAGTGHHGERLLHIGDQIANVFNAQR